MMLSKANVAAKGFHNTKTLVQKGIRTNASRGSTAGYMGGKSAYVQMNGSGYAALPKKQPTNMQFGEGRSLDRPQWKPNISLSNYAKRKLPDKLHLDGDVSRLL